MCGHGTSWISWICPVDCIILLFVAVRSISLLAQSTDSERRMDGWYLLTESPSTVTIAPVKAPSLSFARSPGRQRTGSPF